MKLNVNALDQERKRAEFAITNRFAATAMDIVHNRKRMMAQAIIDGGTASEEFTAAAELENMDVNAFAQLVASKPDVMMTKENSRREKILEVRAATTPEEIGAILEGVGIPSRTVDSMRLIDEV